MENFKVAGEFNTTNQVTKAAIYNSSANNGTFPISDDIWAVIDKYTASYYQTEASSSNNSSTGPVIQTGNSTYNYTLSTSTSTCTTISCYAAYFAILAVLIPIIALILLFTNCLKRRKIRGSMSWKCRTAMKRCKCLCRRPRTYE